MSYHSTTAHLELPQWILSDAPQMSDFNTAFSKIDAFAGPIKKAQTKTISAAELAQAIGLCFSAGDTYKMGGFIANGYITSNAEMFQCYLPLPFLVDNTVGNITLTGNVRLRQNGTYLIGGPQADEEESLTSLAARVSLNDSRFALKLSIDSGISGATNNDTCSALFSNLVLSFGT